MPERSYPFDDSESGEADWLRMARLWAPSHVVGSLDSGAYALTVAGLTATVSCRTGQGTAEAWVDGSMHELTYDAATAGRVAFAVPPNTDPTLARVDRIVLRRDPGANRVRLTHVQGTPAAVPTAPPLAQAPGGVYDLPLWRFTVPPASGAPLAGLVDDRYFGTPDTGWQGATPADPTAAWTAAPIHPAGTASSLGYRGIAWSPSLRLFVAVSPTTSHSQVATSPDGVTWTLRNISSSVVQWTAVVWAAELGLFVALSASATSTGAVATSPDGVTWALRTTPAATGGWRGLCWSPERRLLVAVGANSAASGRVMTSPDGITWTPRTLTAASTPTWQAVVWSPELGLFAAVAALGSGNQEGAATSPDGITWTLRTIPGPTSTDYTGIAWSPTARLFVAAGATSSQGCLLTSSDGANWTQQYPGDQRAFWHAVVWAPRLGLFIAVAINSTVTGVPMIAVSPDGRAWSLRQHPAVLGWQGITVGGPDDRTVVAVSTATPVGPGWAMRAASAALP
jgi:hypothetical protein